MTKDKITKQSIWTEIKVLNAKIDRVLALLEEKKEDANEEFELEEFFQYRQSGDLEIE